MFELLLGHLAGDYLLQNEWMALNKAKNTRIGWLAATVHCMLYTLAVCLFMWKFKFIWIIAVFFSHFFIDKFSLAEWYLAHIKGRSLKEYLNHITEGAIPRDVLDNPMYFFGDQYNNLQAGFNAVVYTITDNTMHLVLMFVTYKLIY